ncbi:hypothetical protein ACI798_02965 [Geodermatophilus sp. SYSU D01045]
MHAQAPVTGPPAGAPAPPAPLPEPAPGAPSALRVAGWSLVAVTVVSALGAAVLDVLTPAAAHAAAGTTPGWIDGLPGVGLAVPAALLLRRAPRNAVSWVLGGTGLLWAVDGLASSWLTLAVRADPALPGATLSFWFLNRFGAWLLLGLPLLLLLYPDGR